MNNDDINRFFLFTSADPGVLDLGFKFASWGVGEGGAGLVSINLSYFYRNTHENEIICAKGGGGRGSRAIRHCHHCVSRFSRSRTTRLKNAKLCFLRQVSFSYS